MDAASVMRGFEYYWKHWNVVNEWRRRHHTACEATHNTIKKMKMETNYPETTEIAVSVDSFEKDENDPTVNNNEHIKSFINCNSDICSNCEDYENDDANDDGELELEFVINDEMIAFFQQSMIHKMELKKQRELQMKNGDVEQKRNMKDDKKSKSNKKENDNSLKKNNEISSTELLSASNEIQFPNVNAKKQKRMQEMNQLYGDAAPKICGMETAVQLSFNRLCDRNKPVYWPCIPFRP